jgi:hypothetical protein
LRIFHAITLVLTAVLIPWIPAAAQQASVPCAIRMTTDPPGALLNIGGSDSTLASPVDTLLPAGSYIIEASHPGYISLEYELLVDPGDTVALEFILLSEQPRMPTPQDLGYEYQPVVPLLMEDQADAVRKKYNTMAEIFAILPLAQGVLAVLALEDGSEYFSGGLVVVGIGLSVGTYLLGRRMASRKLDEIKRTNEMLNEQNAVAEQHNKGLDIEIRRIHAEAMREWQTETTWRGRVVFPDQTTPSP